MTETIKITMLADSTAGKTCYMLAMYGGMHMDNHPFTLTATKEDEDKRLLALWYQMIERKGRERWPPPTSEGDSYTYEFWLNYSNNPLIKFEWLDYRGGAISSMSTQEDSKQLKEYIDQSSCLFLCISGEHLREPVSDSNKGEIMVKTKISNINNYLVYLRQSLNRRKIKYFPVVITISKYDYCFHRNKTELVEDVKQLFPRLFNPNSKWLVMICPVSLGEGLAENRDNGTINPKNCHLPLVFALWSKLREKAIENRKKAKEKFELLEELESNNSLIKFFKKAEISQLEEDIINSENNLEEIERYMSLLSKELDKAYLYLEGDEIDIN